MPTNGYARGMPEVKRASHSDIASRLMRHVGAAAFVVGLAAIVALVVPFFLGESDRPLWLNLIALGAPLGLALVLGSVVRRSHLVQRAVAVETGELEPAGR